MSATSFPTAEINITEATRPASGGTIVAVITPSKPAFADADPVLVMSGNGAVDAVGYSDGTSYAAMHCSQTGQPVLMVPVAIATKGKSSGVVHKSPTGTPTGTSELTVVDDPDGVMTAVTALLTVVEGGTVETPGIVFDISIDGGATTQRIRLNSATSYVIPFIGATIEFGDGTMVDGETYEWKSTAPTLDANGIESARQKLARGRVQVRSWLIACAVDPSLAKAVIDAAERYEKENERFVYVRCNVADGKTASTWRQTATAMNVLFSDVNGWRGSISFGSRRKLCPLTGRAWRRPASWAASLREYDRGMDLHISTWWRDLGPLNGWFTLKSDDEHDERVDTGALFGRFTSFTTLANGDSGMYITKDVTRGNDDSVFFLTNNVAVVDEGCSVCNAATVRILGQSMILNNDGTASPETIADVESGVNSALYRSLMKERVPGRGARASSVRWTMSPADDLRGPGAVVNGIMELNLRGTVSQIRTKVQVS